MSETALQNSLCRSHGVQPDIPAGTDKVGIALKTLSDRPLNGLRHPPQFGSCGWYIWGGTEFPKEDHAFAPLHAEHLSEYCPDAIQFLGLPPGWRFLTDGDYIDVWEDRDLLSV